jgi:hypothetical protein
MTTINASGPLTLIGLHANSDVVPPNLVIDLPTTTWRVILRHVVPVAAGDVLDVDAWFKVTNDTVGRYTVGVGAHLWAYDVDDGKGAARTEADWWKLDADPGAGSPGMNVTRDLHHLVMSFGETYIVPDTWPEGHRIVIALRADAHSTAWDQDGNGRADDKLTVDPCGRIRVRRYAPPVTA